MSQMNAAFVNPFLGMEHQATARTASRLDKLKPANVRRDPALGQNDIVSAERAFYIVSCRSFETKRAQDTKLYAKLVMHVEAVIKGDSLVGEFCEQCFFPSKYDKPSEGKGFQANLCAIIAAAFNVPMSQVYMFNPSNPNDPNLFFTDHRGLLCFNVGVALAHPGNPLMHIPMPVCARDPSGQLIQVGQAPQPVAWKVEVVHVKSKDAKEVKNAQGVVTLERFDNFYNNFSPVQIFRDANGKMLAWQDVPVNNVK